MVNLTDKIIAVIVPEDAYDFYLSNMRRVGKTTIYFWTALIDKHYDGSNCLSKQGWDIPRNNYKIIGTITKSETNEPIFDFDCEKYVEPINDKMYIRYTDYTRRCKTKEESFISLLQSKGIFLEELNNKKLLILEKI